MLTDRLSDANLLADKDNTFSDLTVTNTDNNSTVSYTLKSYDSVNIKNIIVFDRSLTGVGIGGEITFVNLRFELPDKEPVIIRVKTGRNSLFPNCGVGSNWITQGSVTSDALLGSAFGKVYFD